MFCLQLQYKLFFVLRSEAGEILIVYQYNYVSSKYLHVYARTLAYVCEKPDISEVKVHDIIISSFRCL